MAQFGLTEAQMLADITRSGDTFAVVDWLEGPFWNVGTLRPTSGAEEKSKCEECPAAVFHQPNLPERAHTLCPECFSTKPRPW